MINRVSEYRVMRAIFAALAFIFALILPLALSDTACADVRRSDIVMGQTMASRGLKAAQCPSVSAEYAYLVDSEGTVYFERNADTPTQIASITKVMTAIIALENASLDTEITVSQNAAAVGESSAGLWAGDRLTLEEALKGLMIPSGNDAAIAIGECIGAQFLGTDGASSEGGSKDTAEKNARALDAFIEKMNDKASEIGCSDTVFENPHGLDFDEFEGDLHSTAREVALIVAYAMKNNTFREIVDMKSADLSVIRAGNPITVTVNTTDELLGVYEGICGVKTGNTYLAGPCLASACNKEGLELYAILLHATSEWQRFVDAQALYDWVYNSRISYTLAHSDEYTEMIVDEVSSEVPVVAEVALTSWIDKTVPATFSDPDATVAIFALDGNVSQSFEFKDVSGGVRAGQVVGQATFYQRNEEIASIDVVACKDIPGPNIFESFGIWWEKLMRTMSGEPAAAQSVIINDVEMVIDRG